MSYGSEICPDCHGEVKVYVDGDGSCHGTCPTCGFFINYAPRRIPSRIPDEGAFYEVIVEEWYKKDDGAWTNYPRESIAIYTDIRQALRKCNEVRRSMFTADGTEQAPVFPSVKKWDHTRTKWEWVRPEHVEGVHA